MLVGPASLRLQFYSRGMLLTSALLLISSGCTSSLLNMSGDTWSSRLPFTGERDDEAGESEDDDFSNTVDTPLLGDYISVQGNELIALRGVGLVTGLDGTGGDPPPSRLRTEILTEMQRRNIPNPNQILASPNTAIVIVTAYLPAMVRKGDRFDVRVALPPNSSASSLKGGWLLETRLQEEQYVSGRGTLKGHEYAVSGGAIVTGLKTESDTSALLRRGSIPGGAVSRTERDLKIVIRSDKKSFRTASRIEDAVSRRFHHYDRYGQRVSLANAKSPSLIELKIHPTYRNDFPRYQQVIRQIPLQESDVARRMRMEILAEELLDAETTQLASLRLEALGDASVPFLKDGIRSSDPEVRFYSAVALAYLGDASGTQVLHESAAEEPAFRVFALAALSVLDDADAILSLRELMHEPDLETRYGAFLALKESSPGDPFLGMMEFDKGVQLHLIDSKAEPAVHIRRRHAPEIVLFDISQRFRTPLVLKAGRRFRVMSDEATGKVRITRYEIGRKPDVRAADLRIAEVLRVLGEAGATYPDLVQLLIEADLQGNLPGELGVDELPRGGRTYLRQAGTGGQEDHVRLSPMTPGLYGQDPDSKEEADPYSTRNRTQRDVSLQSRIDSTEPAELVADSGEPDQAVTVSPEQPEASSFFADESAEAAFAAEEEEAAGEPSIWSRVGGAVSGLNPFRRAKESEAGELPE